MEHPLQQLIRRFVSAATAPIGEGSSRNAAIALRRHEESQRQETEALAGLINPGPRLPASGRATA